MADVLLGVSGGIAAYKSIDVLRILQRRGHDVTVVMTRAAQRFVGPATFAALSGHPVGVDLFGAEGRPGYDHLELARGADLLLVAPASANTIARMAAGLGDGLLGSVLPGLRRPGADRPGHEHAHVPPPGHGAPTWRCCVARGVEVIAPGSGLLADGEVGVGRLADPAEIADAVEARLAGAGHARGAPGAGERRRHARADRPGALRGQPLQRAHGLGRGRGGAPARGAEVTVLASNVDLPRHPDIRYVDAPTAADLHARRPRGVPRPATCW